MRASKARLASARLSGATANAADGARSKAINAGMAPNARHRDHGRFASRMGFITFRRAGEAGAGQGNDRASDREKNDGGPPEGAPVRRQTLQPVQRETERHGEEDAHLLTSDVGGRAVVVVAAAGD